MAAPQLTPFSVWALRHEYHLQYLALTLAQRMVGIRQPPPLPPYLFSLPPFPCRPLSPSCFSGTYAASGRTCNSCFPLDVPLSTYPLCLYPHPYFSFLRPLSNPWPPAFCPQATLQPVPATNAALHHSMALALLSRLLPGSEHLAHELLLSCIFRLEFLP